MKTIGKAETRTVAGKHKRLRRALAKDDDTTDIEGLTLAVSDALRVATGTRESVGRAALVLLAAALQGAGVSLETDRRDPALIDKLNRLCALPPEPAHLRRTVRLLAALSVTEATRGPRLDFQFGYDGHALTREQAARLGLVRYFESASSGFAALVGKAFAFLAQSGPAYLAWTRRLPLLICDLNRPSHRDCARLMRALAGNDLVVVSPACAPDVSARAMGNGYERLYVEDTAGLMKGLVGIEAEAVLLERRLAGWTVTFATGCAHPKDLADKRLPAAWRALARTACREERRAGEPLEDPSVDGHGVEAKADRGDAACNA